MSKVKLYIREGIGTQKNPYTSLSGSDCLENVMDLEKNHHVTHVAEYAFEPDEDGNVQVSDDVAPVIRLEHINNLNGKLLTHIDALFSDPEQRKAVKDLMSQSLFQWYFGMNEIENR